MFTIDWKEHNNKKTAKIDAAPFLIRLVCEPDYESPPDTCGEWVNDPRPGDIAHVKGL